MTPERSLNHQLPLSLRLPQPHHLPGRERVNPMRATDQLSCAIARFAVATRNRVSNLGQALGKRGQRRLDRLPHDPEVNIEEPCAMRLRMPLMLLHGTSG